MAAQRKILLSLLAVAAFALLLISILVIIHIKTGSHYRKAKIEHIGTMKITPDVTSFIGNNSFFILTSGKNVSAKIHYCLFQNTNICREWRKNILPFRGSLSADWEIEWILKPEFNKNKYYVLCYNCSVDYIAYYPNSKYDNQHGVDEAVINDYKISPLPYGESIKVYTIDEPLYKVP